MRDVLALVPLFAFMLIPVWIPLIATVLGAVADRVAPPKKSLASRSVEAAKARTARTRATLGWADAAEA